MEIISKEEFESATPFIKGYLVYMFGSRQDQPNIPEVYKCENPYEQYQYNQGERHAILLVQDMDES